MCDMRTPAPNLLRPTLQIPQKLQAQGGRGVVVEHAFGREFPEIEEGEAAGQ